MSRLRFKTYLTIIIILVTVTIGLLTVRANKQSISDWLALLNYQPPTTISTIATQDGMTAYTRKVFYVNHPQIDSKTVFAKECPDNSEQNVVLGCYHLNQQGIFVLSVNNTDLQGIEQVTAAYETLHATYQRLSPSAQTTLNSELVTFENHGLNNSTVESQIAGFRKTEPGGVLNEMTSLFGTEVQNLPANLSAFYSKYFSDRQTLLNYYNDYETAFSSRQQEINSFDNQLNSLHATIDSDESQLHDQLAVIQSEQSTLNNERGSNVSQYNASVPGYNQQVDAYDSLIETVGSLVDQYNAVIAQRNSIAFEEQQLTQAITSNVQPVNNQ